MVHDVINRSTPVLARPKSTTDFQSVRLDSHTVLKNLLDTYYYMSTTESNNDDYKPSLVNEETNNRIEQDEEDVTKTSPHHVVENEQEYCNNNNNGVSSDTDDDDEDDNSEVDGTVNNEFLRLFLEQRPPNQIPMTLEKIAEKIKNKEIKKVLVLSGAGVR